MATTSPSPLTRDRVPLFPSAAAALAPAVPAAAAGWRRLTFTEQAQEQTEWCWDASSLSIHAYYDPDSTWTQCAFAGRKIGRTDCCAHPDSDVCTYQLRTLRVPPLKVVALWLHGDDDDLYIPWSPQAPASLRTSPTTGSGSTP